MTLSTPNHERPSKRRMEFSVGGGTPRERALTAPRRMLLALAAVGTLALVPQAAFAQRGGGGGHFGGGGGHFGGGSGHYGGGGHASSHVSTPRTTGMRSSGSPSGAAVRPGNAPVNFGRDNPSVISRGAVPLSFARPGGRGFAAGSAGRAEPVPQHVTIGFPPASGAGGSGASGSGFVEHGTSGWRPMAPVQSGVPSFSGQGHDIWQDNARGNGVGAENARPLLESRPIETQRPHAWPPRLRPRFFGPGYGYGYGFGGLYPWGFGLGFDFGGLCDPSWNFGCYGYGYGDEGYYGPYAGGLYLGASGDDSAAAADNSADYSSYAQNAEPSDSSESSSGQTTVLYLNDGTSFAVTDYWVADYKLHYIVDGARENTIDLDQIDVQRTVDENAARGVNFTLRPGPDSSQE